MNASLESYHKNMKTKSVYVSFILSILTCAFRNVVYLYECEVIGVILNLL